MLTSSLFKHPTGSPDLLAQLCAPWESRRLALTSTLMEGLMPRPMMRERLDMVRTLPGGLAQRVRKINCRILASDASWQPVHVHDAWAGSDSGQGVCSGLAADLEGC